MRIPISERARRFGYIIWPSSMDEEVRATLGTRDEVEVFFDGKELGTKRVDWSNRRISVGVKQTAGVDAGVKTFEVRIGADGKLLARCV